MLSSAGHWDEQDGVENPTGSFIEALSINRAVPIDAQINVQERPHDVVDEFDTHPGFVRTDLVDLDMP